VPTYLQKSRSPISRESAWRSYLDALTWQRGQLDRSANLAFLRAASLQIPEQTAFDEILCRCRDAGDRPRAAKLRHQLASAYRRVTGGTLGVRAGFNSSFSARPKWPETNYDAIDRIIRTGFGLVDLWERSPIRFEDSKSSTEEIVDVLFPNNPGIDPLLCVGWGSKGQSFKTKRQEWRGNLHRLEFIVPNPMVNVWGHTKDGKLSQHSLEATGRRVYQVIEFDFDREHSAVIEWLANGLLLTDINAALHWHLARLMPLVCVVFSGGESLHGWYNVFDRSELEQRFFMNEALRLGADPALWYRSQFTRLPDARRYTGGRQTCFYLDPQNAVKL
jgi:hypothetical protein